MSVPSRHDIVTFHDPPVPPGASPWVDGTGPSPDVAVIAPDPAWPQRFDEVAAAVRRALGWRALVVEHVGSTAVPGLPAKPVIDVDLVVADPADEASYVPALEALGFVLRVREPWWFQHRLLRGTAPVSHVHVFGPESPEVVKHRIFRDWLRGNPEERERYAAAKLAASAASTAAGEHGMQYNARKERMVREIYARAFAATGLT
ncbi:GrpB family protein [Nocardioides sp. LHD-245]|uniref:GrpB family protein n=1 Tax=Nocardioides sp. LHD-245 TaxID=3051387 RepID=UPI0027DECB52|nr:GrpB family protein [Nocardioides sp. LHD-245]